jgi:hypothetical protein
MKGMKKSFGIIVALAFFVLPLAVFAQQTVIQQTGNTYSPPAQTQPVNSVVTGVTVSNPLGVSSFCGLIKALLTGAIQIGIPIAVLFIVYAGFKFVLARGNAEKLKEARQNFLWTIIGIAIFLAAWLLANVIANTVNSLGSTGPSALISCQ